MGIGEISELEERCLSVITKNFDRYFQAFKLRNSSAQAGHLEFLARLYSEVLIERLELKILLERPHYLDFLINRHLRVLKVNAASHTHPAFPRILMDKLQTYGGSILSLEADSDSFEATFYESLMSALPNVEYVRIFDFAHFADDIPALISILQSIGRNCPHLEVLKCAHYLKRAAANVFHDSVSFVIKHCPRLKVLQFYDSVGALYNLHKSDLDLVKGKADVKQYAKHLLKKLYSESRNYPIGDALEICSVLCPHVSSLFIEKVECDQDLEKISRFTLLENVDLGGMDMVSLNSLNQFLMLRGSKLISLDLSQVSCLSVYTLTESCPKLQYLKLGVVGHSCNSSNERSKTSLRNLKALELTNCNFAEEGVAEAVQSILSGATKLENFYLSRSSGLKNVIFSSSGLNQLRSLTVTYSDIEVDALKELMLCGSLQNVFMYQCPNITHRDLTKDIPSDRIPHIVCVER